jgi:hypothetical protein
MGESSRLEEFLAPYPDHVVRTMLEGRAILLQLLQPVVELHYDATSAVCAGFAYSSSVKDLFVNLAAYPNHVTLVFAHGASLIDPHGKLSGTGKQVRHLRLQSASDLKHPAVLSLVEQASLVAPRPEGVVTHEVIAKVYDGVKRRPK